MNSELYCNTCKRLANTLCVEMKHETEMRDEQQHTPTPWRYQGWDDMPGDRGAYILGGGPLDSAAEYMVGAALPLPIVNRAECEANARFIVRAANNHAALLAALREAKQIIKTWHGPEAWEIYDQHSPEMIRLNRTLALAEEDQS